MMHLTDRISEGRATWGDVELLQDVATQIKGKCLCALGDFSTEAVLSGIQRFREDFEKKVVPGESTGEQVAQADIESMAEPYQVATSR
jgi:NADH:ubiquinone oxidoreductase subunit F (NADH-binding)